MLFYAALIYTSDTFFYFSTWSFFLILISLFLIDVYMYSPFPFIFWFRARNAVFHIYKNSRGVSWGSKVEHKVDEYAANEEIRESSTLASNLVHTYPKKVRWFFLHFCFLSFLSSITSLFYCFYFHRLCFLSISFSLHWWDLSLNSAGTSDGRWTKQFAMEKQVVVIGARMT